MTFLYSLATLWPKLEAVPTQIRSMIFKPASKGHKLVYVRQALLLPLFCFINLVVAHAQSGGKQTDTGIKEIRPLNIGDTIPEAVWNMPLQVVNHPTGKKSITLNDYRGKLIILDFWATWCSACIAAMPRLHLLEQELNHSFEILSITTQSKALVDHFIKQNKILDSLDLTTVAQDFMLKSLFPHRLVPHYVWIDKTGTITAFTGADEIDKQSVVRAINGSTSNMQQKFDQDTSLPIFTSNILPQSQLSFYSILIKGQYSGFGGGVNYRQLRDTTFGILITNSSLLYLYEIALGNLLPDYPNKRMLIETKHPENLYYNGRPDALWKKKNFYSFEIRVPMKKADQLYQIMLDQLNQVSGYYGKIEQRKIRCLVLKSKSTATGLKTKGEKFVNDFDRKGTLKLSNAPMLALTGQLNNVLESLVIDETSINQNIDLTINLQPNNLLAIQDELGKYGFSLVQEIRETSVLVLSDN